MGKHLQRQPMVYLIQVAVFAQPGHTDLSSSCILLPSSVLCYFSCSICPVSDIIDTVRCVPERSSTTWIRRSSTMR